jgi:hypothetical protein
LDTVQYSFVLTQGRLVPKRHQANVLEAVMRCQASRGNLAAVVPGAYDGIAEDDGDEDDGTE